MSDVSREALKARLYAALKHEKSCGCGECSGGLNAVDALLALVEQQEKALRELPEQLASCVEYMEKAEKDGLEPWSIAATTVLCHAKVMLEDVTAALSGGSDE